jgi:hypothetical protein
MKSSNKKLWRSPWFWLVALAIAAFAAFMIFSDTGKAWIEGVNDWAEGVMSAHPVLGAILFLALTAVSAILAFASTVVLVPAASEAWGTPLTFALLWAGWPARSSRSRSATSPVRSSIGWSTARTSSVPRSSRPGE